MQPDDPSESRSVPEKNLEVRFNELRSEILDRRATYIDRWLVAVAIFLTLFGIVVAVAGYFAFERFERIESRARDSLKSVEESASAAKTNLRYIDAILAINNHDRAEYIASRIRRDPTASALDRVVADALLFQDEGQLNLAIEKWRYVANASEGVDNEVASGAWFSVGQLHERNMDLEKAISAYEQAVRIRPTYAHAFKHLGSIKAYLDKYEEAFADFARAISLRPGYSEAYILRGRTWHSLEQYEAAINDYDEAIRLKPNHADGYFRRGHANLHLKRYEDAITDYDAVIRLKPGDIVAYMNRGWAALSLGSVEKARRILRLRSNSRMIRIVQIAHFGSRKQRRSLPTSRSRRDQIVLQLRSRDWNCAMPQALVVE